MTGTTQESLASQKSHRPQEPQWECSKCGGGLQKGKVTVSYLGNDFVVEEWKCPACGLVLITEELALGQMAEVEQNLEDK